MLKFKFLKSLEKQDLSNICSLLQNKNATLSVDIDRELKRTLVESAEISNVFRTPCRAPRKNQWFDRECHVKRLNIEEDRKMYRNYRSITEKKQRLKVTKTSFS